MTHQTHTRQHRLLFRLAQAEGERVSYENLARAAWPTGDRPPGWMDGVKVSVFYLRGQGYRIKNARGFGYRLSIARPSARPAGLRIHMVA